MKRAPLVALAFIALLSCGGIEHRGAFASPPNAPESVRSRTGSLRPSPTNRVVIVAIDGARWQEIFEGTDPVLVRANGMAPTEVRAADDLVPNIRALGRRGLALGGDESTSFEASGPNFVSLPGYTEILTGRPAPCQENACEARPERTIADEARALSGVGLRDVAVISSWERIDAVAAGDPTSVIVSAGRTHGATRERLADDSHTKNLLHDAEHGSPLPGHDDYRPDRETARIARSYFEHARPKLMFVSLGDSDEYAHAGNYRGYLDALSRADAFVGDLEKIAKTFGPEGDDVTFFITADHGRSADFRDHGRDYPESARSWLVAAGRPLTIQGRPAKAHLRDIAPTVRQILGVPADADRMAGSPIEELFDPSGSQIASRN